MLMHCQGLSTLQIRLLLLRKRLGVHAILYRFQLGRYFFKTAEIKYQPFGSNEDINGNSLSYQ